MREFASDSDRSCREFEPESPFTLPGFFDALEDGELLAGVCKRCSTRLIPPRPYCYSCGSSVVDVDVQPLTGIVYSFTEVRRPPSGFEGSDPYTIGIVELNSGARLIGRVTAGYNEVNIGMEVAVRFDDAPMDDEVANPYEAGWPIPVFDPE